MIPREASVFWIETSEEEVHFIDAIVSAYDGLANVRRDYKLEDGKIYFQVFVAPGMEEEFLGLLEKLRRSAAIGDVLREQDGASPSSS